jgi:hypothetical protein
MHLNAGTASDVISKPSEGESDDQHLSIGSVNDLLRMWNPHLVTSTVARPGLEKCEYSE